MSDQPLPSRPAAAGLSTASLPASLRAATADAHTSIERTFDLSWMLSSLGTYQRTLAALYGFFAVVEPRLEAMLPHPDFYPARRKLPLLQRDLRALGLAEADIARLPLCNRASSPRNRHEALGILYVLEGATLGGAIIARATASRLGADAPTSYFNAYGSYRGRMWTEFRCRLSEADGPESHQAIAAARICFAVLEAWLAETKCHVGRSENDPRRS